LSTSIKAVPDGNRVPEEFFGSRLANLPSFNHNLSTNHVAGAASGLAFRRTRTADRLAGNL